MAEEIEEIKDPNPEIKTYKIKGDSLIIEKTHAEPKVNKEVHDIKKAQKHIDKINCVITQWQNKKAHYQTIIDKYNELNEVY